jgi:hypothetical protein
MFFTFSSEFKSVFLISAHLEKIASSQNPKSSENIDLLLGKCLYRAASVIPDFSAKTAVVTLDKFLSSRRPASD